MPVGDISVVEAARIGRKGKRKAALVAAAAASAVVLPAARSAAQTLYYSHPGGGDWFTVPDAYKGWRFDGFGGFLSSDLPPAGSSAMVLQGGTNGIGGETCRSRLTCRRSSDISAGAISRRAGDA